MRDLASELRPIAAGLSAGLRFYADANLPVGLVTALRTRCRWDVLHVIEHDDLRRAADRIHYRRAWEFGRTIVTLDYDFFDDRRFPLDRSPGVVICSAPDEAALLKLLRRFDRWVRRTHPDVPMPLRGRKLELTPDTRLGRG